MSDLDFDNISSLLDDVLSDKPIGESEAEAQPATPEEVAVAAEIAQPAETEDILGSFMDDLASDEATVITTPPDPAPDSIEAIDAEILEVTQCVTGEEPCESEANASPSETGTPTEDLQTPDAGDEIADEAGDTTTDGIEVAEHVFADAATVETIPLPTFTTDDIAESLDIRNFATLVTLNTARWHAKAKDIKAARDAAAAAGADKDTFETRKKLLVGCDAALKAVHKAIDAARTEHYRLTLPWSTVGVNDQGKRAGGRLMPNTLFMEYTTAMAKCKAEMDALLIKFVAVYPTLVTEVQSKLGTAFDPAQYPNPSSIQGHFRLSFDFNPIPVGSDFKGLQDAQIQKLGTSLNKKTRTMLENALQDAWATLYESVQNAVNRLSNPDSMFHSTLITKLQDQAKMLTHLNATKDPRMEEVRKLVEDKLTKHDPVDIRKDDALRKRLAEDALAVQTRMEEIASA